MTSDATTTWTPLLALLAGVLLALSTGWWWPRAWRWVRLRLTIWRVKRVIRRNMAESMRSPCPLSVVQERVEPGEELDDEWFEDGPATKRSRRDG